MRTEVADFGEEAVGVGLHLLDTLSVHPETPKPRISVLPVAEVRRLFVTS